MKMIRLKNLLAEHGMTQTDLARLMKRDKAAITNLLQGKRTLKASEAILIANHLGVSLEEVLGIENPAVPPGLEETVLIPFQHTPSAKRRTEGAIIRKHGKYFLQAQKVGFGKSYALEVKDDSMNLSGLLAGDIIISALDAPCKKGQIVVVQHYLPGGAETLLRKYTPPLLLPHSTNPKYTPLHEEEDDVRVVSPVLQALRYFS